MRLISITYAETDAGAPSRGIQELEQENEALRERLEEVEEDNEHLRRENEQLRNELRAAGARNEAWEVPPES